MTNASAPEAGTRTPGLTRGGNQPVVRYLGKLRRRTRLVTRLLRVFVKPFLALYSRWPGLPWPYGLVDRLAFWIPALPGTTRRPLRLPDCRAELLHARDAANDRVLLHMHGGAFLVCGLRTHRMLASTLSAATGAAVLNVGYRVLPKAPISSSVEDGLSAYQWLLDQGYRAEQIVLSGDSAGGYLALMLALAVRDEGLPRPAGVVALSPLTDFDNTAKLAHPNAELDPLFPKRALRAIATVADRTDARVNLHGERGPRISPVDSDLRGLPPVLIQVGSTELLLPDAELMAERLGAAGVPVHLQIWRGQPHVFQAAAALLPEARAACHEIGEFTRNLPPETPPCPSLP